MANDTVIGIFDSEKAILRAAKAMRDEGMPARDAHTPFAVHGLDDALQLDPSPLPRLCLIFGTAGLILTLSFQYWVSVFDWPMNIGGKSYNASPALIPVAFELTVLFAGIGSVLAFFRIGKLFPGKDPSFPDSRAVDDRFVLVLDPAPDAKGREKMRRLLEQYGAIEVRNAK